MLNTSRSAFSPITYRPAYELLDESEQQRQESLQYTLRKISEITDSYTAGVAGSVHAQSHGLITAEMEIFDNLPAHLAQGMFAQAKTLPLVMRFSTVPGDILNDKRCTPRSLALKVLGVDGVRLPGSESAMTQDLLFVNGSSFLSSSVQQFLANLQMLEAKDNNSPGFKQFLSQILQATSKLLGSLGKQADTQPQEANILGETFFSQDPILYGNYMAKIALVPVAPALTTLTDKPVDLTFASDGLRKSIVDFFIAHTAVWELRVQLCTDIDRMPIEDSSVIWSEDVSPYIAVARITAKPQIAWSPYRSHLVDEGMMFSPWHGLQCHRPLGSVMRLKRLSYQMSRNYKASNGSFMTEPTSLDDLC